MDNYLFQYCQKIVVFRNDDSEVLLCKRKGENDFDGIYSFIGGKMETTDATLVEGMKREKSEEIGPNVKLNLFPLYSTHNFFIKKDGNAMVLHHYYARYVEGEIKINDEYSDYKWVKISELKSFEPKIPNVSMMAKLLLKLKPLMKEDDLIII